MGPRAVIKDGASADVAIVGAGAAGLATAIFTRRANPARSVLLLEGALKPGAKILVSGGGRCNVTNRVVSEREFWGGRRSIIRRILRSFPASDTVEFFQELGVALNEEADGKLFPVSGHARDVLTALWRGAEAAGVRLATGSRVSRIERSPSGFHIAIARRATESRASAPIEGQHDARIEVQHDARIEGQEAALFESQFVVLATGGQSLPKSGSDGVGYAFARSLGHTIVPTTPALVPLMLGGQPHGELSGVSHDAELAVWVDGRISTRLSGSLLWTHFGISGPVAMNASRHWLRAQTEGRQVRLTASFIPGMTFEGLEKWWTTIASSRPKISVTAALALRVPAAVAAIIVGYLNIVPCQLAHLTRADRRKLTSALVEWPLAVTGCRGWNYAEATAGGVALDEIDAATMESRKCPGLYLVGEILDVDGRIGGFNFQWAWSSAYVAGRSLSRGALPPRPPHACHPIALENARRGPRPSARGGP